MHPVTSEKACWYSHTQAGKAMFMTQMINLTFTVFS